MNTLCDRIGTTYARTRRADPRLAARIRRALGDDIRSVVNVGAGTGSYEPSDLAVVAVEPSQVMIGQRAPGSAPVVVARAEQLPFPDDRFDAAMAVWTVHHWDSPTAGLSELRRVARSRVVVATWDPDHRTPFWLREYLPVMWDADTARFLPLAAMTGPLGPCRIEALPVPADCADGFAGAFWARPEAYLDPVVRAGISSIARLPQDAVEAGVSRLSDDLASGAWDARHGSLRHRPEMDLGYRLLIAG